MAKQKKPYMTIDDVEELGLTPEVAPTVDREIMVPDDGIYLGQNGRKYEDMNFVGSGEFIPVTEWGNMPAGYTMVTNPYMAVSPDKGAERRKMAEAAGVKVSAADVDFLSDDEFQATIDNKLGFAAAQAAGDEEGMNYYRDAQNAMRMAKGYYGGVDGMLYNGVMVNTSGLNQDQYDQYVSGQEWVNGLNQELGGINSGNVGQYVSQYQQQIDALSAEILGRGKFSYNKDTDPLYQQYKESYTRGGQRGMRDTLGQVAARTGGIASSYATAAAQQTYNNYMAELANKVPELQQLAYSMYMDELNGQRSDLSMLMGLEQDAFNRFANERDFAYGVSRDQVADSQWQQNFAYQQAMDALAQQNWEKEFGYKQDYDKQQQQNWQTQFDYGKDQDAQAQQNWQSQFDYGKQQDAQAQQNWQSQEDYDKALSNAQLLASVGDFSGYRALGLTDAQIAALTDAYQSELDQEQADRDWDNSLAAAQLLAGYGDYSGYKVLGLTDEQIAFLNDSYQSDLDLELAADDYDKALANAKLLASYGNFSGYKALGMSDEDIAFLTNAYQAELQAGSGSYSGGGSGTGGGSQTGGAGIWDVISKMSNEAEVYDYLIRNGATATETKNWIGYWQDLQGDNWRQQVDAGTTDIKSTSGNYKAVDEHMKSLLRGDEENEPMDPGEVYKFLEEAYQDGLVTREEFEKLKAKYQV